MPENAARTIGWWVFDAEASMLVNRFSEQRVRFAQAVGDGGTRLRFSYADPEITACPVLLTRAYNRHGQLTWLVDHLASSTEWRRAAGAEVEHPPYGLWRRVDECLFDAFGCWPETAATGLAPSSTEAVGGWWNGAWTPRLHRTCYGHAQAGKPVENIVRPYLEPLTSEPLSWRFVDALLAVPGIEPAGIKTVSGGWRSLPRAAGLAGFETAIPHLRRSDGAAVMFPHRIKSNWDRDGDYVPHAQFFYADEDVFFVLDGEGVSYREGRWEFHLDDLIDFGSRRDRKAPRPGDVDLSQGLVCSRQIHSWRGPNLQPLPRLAHRLTASLTDGWLVWADSKLRLLDEPEHLAWMTGQKTPYPMPPLEKSGISLAAKAKVSVRGGYAGGQFSRHEFEAVLQAEG